MRPVSYRQAAQSGLSAILHEGLIGVIGRAGLQEITYAHALEDGTATFDAR